MKKTLIIILALVLILVGGIWVYLMVFGAPESSDELFADLGFESTAAPTDVTRPERNTDESTATETAIDATKKLNLLTLTPTAGGVIVGTTTEQQTVRYVERGSGVIHEINLANNTETILTSNELTKTRTAVWSPDGSAVVIVSGDAFNPIAQLYIAEQQGTSSQVTFSPRDLPQGAYEFGFSPDSTELYYLRTDLEGSLAYVYDLGTKEARVWFTLPFIAPAVVWGNVPLVYNRPGEDFVGYAYRYRNNMLESVGAGGSSLVAESASDTTEFISVQNGNTLTSFIASDQDQIQLPYAVIPEKCTSLTSELVSGILCAAPQTSQFTLIDWYKGLLSSNDTLWGTNIELGQSFEISNLQAESGQAIDVINLSVDQTGTRLLFTDKNSNALWMYDIQAGT